MATTNRFKINNLRKEHDIYVDFMKRRQSNITENGAENTDVLFPNKRGSGLKNFLPEATGSTYRAISKWHCMVLTYDIWYDCVKDCIVWKGTIEYKKSVRVPIDILKKFKYRVECAIKNAKCDYNKHIPRGHYDACKYLVMFWTYLDIIKDEKTQRFIPDSETRKRMMKIFGYQENDDPFMMKPWYYYVNKENKVKEKIDDSTKKVQLKTAVNKEKERKEITVDADIQALEDIFAELSENNIKSVRIDYNDNWSIVIKHEDI